MICVFSKCSEFYGEFKYLSASFAVRQRAGFWHFSRVFSTFHPMCQNIVPWGGGCICILFEICVKCMGFRNVWVWGG